MRFTYWVLSCAMGLAVAMPLTQAHAYAEVGDAGQTLATAQAVPGGTTQITGELVGSDDVDMYRFGWNGGHFIANTFGSAHIDPMLSLFDASGHGVFMDDDTGFFIDNTQFGLPAYIDIANLAAGTYYLALSGFPDFALNGTDLLFACSNSCGPVDPNATLTGWQEFNGGPGTYVINISTTAEVPEPGAMALLAAGLLGLAVVRRRTAG